MDDGRFDRRSLLVAGGAAAVLGALNPAGAAAKFSADPFSMGVASGDPTPDGFVLWTRLAPQPLAPDGGMPTAAVSVAFEVAEDARFRTIVRVGQAIARRELAHSVHVEVSALKPHRRYWYRFLVDGIYSDVGTVRTAPAAHAPVNALRIVVAGCQHFERGLFTAWRHVSREADVDFIYHYGDYIYEGRPTPFPAPGASGAPVVRQHDRPEIYSLDDYRRRYALYKIDPDLRAAHASAAFVASFDDHEVDNDWGGDRDQDGTPPDIFRLRRAAAMQAWYEHMPVRLSQLPRDGRTQMYRRLDFGSLLRVHVLDGRSYRSIRLCETPVARNCVDGRDHADSLLGAGQEDWLSDGLKRGAVWNLLALGGMVMPFDRSLQRGGGKGYDNWTGYPDSRARLVEMITTQRLRNVVIAGGDGHMFYLGHLPSRAGDLESASVATEFHATSISSPSGNGIPIGPDPRIATNPHMRVIHDQRGYLLFDVTPTVWQASLRGIDQTFTPGGVASTLSRYAVTPDRPVLMRD